MVNRLVICAFVMFAISACGGPAGTVSPPRLPDGGAGNHLPAAADRTTLAHRTPEPKVFVKGLTEPSAFALDKHDVYVGTAGSVIAAKRNGKGVKTLVTGTTLYDSGSNRPVNRLVVSGNLLYFGYGGYNTYQISRAPITGGTSTPLTTSTGGYFIGVNSAGDTLYYGAGFNEIRAMPASGGTATTVLSGYWVRNNATDGSKVWFQDYWSRGIYAFDFTTHQLTTVLPDQPQNAQIVLNATTVFVSGGTTIQAISKVGGAPATIYTGTEPILIAANDQDVVFNENGVIYAVPVSGGPPHPLAAAAHSYFGIATEHRLIFSDDSAGDGNSVLEAVRLR